MRRPSLTLRLTLLFAAGSTVVLVVLGYLVGVSVQQHFVEIDRDELLGKIELVRHILSKSRTAADFTAIPGRIDDAIIGHPHLFVRVSDPGGRLLFTTEASRFPDHLFPMVPAQDTPASPEIATWNHGGHSFRGTMVNVDTPYPDTPRVVVAVAISIDHHEAFFDVFTTRLWLSIAICILVTAVLGWIAAARGLAPVREMAAVAQSISASRLHDRLGIETLPSELVDLAIAFNGMLARLEDSFTRLSDFSSDLAHELQTPLSNVMTQTQVALSRSRSADEYREVLYSSLEECDRLARTVADMLFLAKADHGQIIPTVEGIDLAREVRELFEFYDALVEDRGVTLACTGEGSIAGDKLMMRRALGNLLSNAIAHTPPGGCVKVSIGRNDAGLVTLGIENPGETIPAEHLPRLFDRFYRVDPARQRSSGGAGLGLAITRSIVAAHGGTIDVSSANGLTRFEMSLPPAGTS
jgi:two-component system, OmpR family, heavy metal sensor histidine kinase CusS